VPLQALKRFTGKLIASLELDSPTVGHTHTHTHKGKKLTFTLEEVTKVQRGSRGVALLLL